MYFFYSYLVCKLQWHRFKLMIEINHNIAYSWKRLFVVS